MPGLVSGDELDPLGSLSPPDGVSLCREQPPLVAQLPVPFLVREGKTEP